MATLIPALGACVSRMTSGERRVAQRLEDKLDNAYSTGHAWGDMAILCLDYSTRDLCAQVLHQRQMPVEMRRSSSDFNPGANAIQIMTTKVSKGLEFPVVATRAKQRLLIGVGGDGGFGNRHGNTTRETT
jgi:ATP-dependent exoDNAse (exonuclease V) beta subunit